MEIVVVLYIVGIALIMGYLINRYPREEAQKKHHAAKRRSSVLSVHVTGWRFYI